jgi:hypothetical protein
MTEPSDAATWKSIPSWHIFGTRDNSIPANLLAFMAETRWIEEDRHD